MSPGTIDCLLRGASLQGDATTLDVATATCLGRALGTFARRRGAGAGPLVVARCPSVDGLVARNGLVRGLLLSGTHVADVGVCDAEIFADALRSLAASGGIFITAASLEDADPTSFGHAALTIFLGAQPLATDELRALLEIAAGDRFSAGVGKLSLIDAAVVPSRSSRGGDETPGSPAAQGGP